MFKSVGSLSPAMTSHEKDQTSYSTVESDDRACSDPSVKADTLPDDQPVHFLAEAQTLYSNGRQPPFVLNKRSEVMKTVVIPNKYGLRPRDDKAVKAKIIAKPWDKNLMFWTLDLNGTRYIVKPFNGQAQGGMRYLYWAGPGRDFEPKPLALSFISPSQPGTTSSTRRDGILPDRSTFVPVNRKRSIPSDYFASSDSSNSSDSSDSEVEVENNRVSGLARNVTNAGVGQAVQQVDDSTSDHGDHARETKTLDQLVAAQNGPAKRRKTEISDHETDELYRVSPPARRRSDAHVQFREHQPGPGEPLISASTRPANDREERRKQSAIARIEKDLGRKFDQIFTPWAGEDQTVSRNTLAMILKVLALMEDSSPQRISRLLNKAVNGGDGKRQDAGGLRPTRPVFKTLEATLKATTAGIVNDTSGGRTGTPSSSSGINRQQLHQRTSQRNEDVSGKGTEPNLRSVPSLEDNRDQPEQDLDSDLLSSTILPQHKQNRTILFVRVEPSPEYLPLKLSECMTPRDFYAKVLSAWGIRGENVAKITVAFAWMDLDDKMRTMIMNSKMEGCFEHLLEQVDEAPVWEERGKGKCGLDVQIVLKE